MDLFSKILLFRTNDGRISVGLACHELYLEMRSGGRKINFWRRLQCSSRKSFDRIRTILKALRRFLTVVFGIHRAPAHT